MDDETIRFTREQLYEKVWSKPMSSLAKEWGISDVGLAKICRRYNIPRPGLGHWARKQHGYNPIQPPLPQMEGEAIIEIHSVRKQDRLLGPKQAQEVAERTAPEKEMENQIVVPKVMINPHPLVAKTEKSLQASKPDDRGIIRASGPGTLSTVLGPNSIGRAMHILDTLIKALEKRGMRVKVEDAEIQGSQYYSNGRSFAQGKTLVSVLGEWVEIGLEEHAHRKDHELTQKEKEEQRMYGRVSYSPKYDFIPNGRLILRIKNVYSGHVRHTWSDTAGKRLENVLNSFIVGLTNAAVHIRASRLERERENREREERRRIAEEEERRRRQEEQRFKILEEQVANWQKSQNIRQYVEAVRKMAIWKYGAVEPGSNLDTWIKWATRQANRLDPLIMSFPFIQDVGDEYNRGNPGS
jgi:hypothetical protein